MIPVSHHGTWKGPNRLWVTDPDRPMRSQGSIECTANGIEYRWANDDKAQNGTIELAGQSAALRMAFRDSFHAEGGMTLHGHLQDKQLRAYGTYGAGPGQPEWGWIVELDWRDPEALVMRMFNVVPEVGSVPAVILQGSR